MIVYTLGCMLIWLIKKIVKVVKVVLIYMSTDLFKLFNITSLCISLALIVTWIEILSYDNFLLLPSGLINTTTYTYIDLISDSAQLYDSYNLLSAINAIIIFFRIL